MVRVHLLLKLKPPKKNLLMCVILLFVLIIAFVDVAVCTHPSTHCSVHFNICAKIVNGNRINRVQWMWKKSLVSVIHSFIHSFAHSLARSLVRSFVRLLIHSYIYLFALSFAHIGRLNWLTRSLSCSPTTTTTMSTMSINYDMRPRFCALFKQSAGKSYTSRFHAHDSYSPH